MPDVGGLTHDQGRDPAAGDLPARFAAIGRRLDFESVAQQIVDAVIEVTDFKVATLTVREGDRCRRLATAGLPDGRIGMTTPYEHWEVLLRLEWRRGSNSYLVPPEAPARWADVPDLVATDDPDAWTADHGLILPLGDYAGEVIGFIAVDEPRSGLLPDAATIDRLEAFAREAQAAFVNARLYAIALRQAQTTAELFDVAKTMASTSDLDQVVPRIIQAMGNRYDAHEVTIGRVTGTEIELRRLAADTQGEVHTSHLHLAGPVLELLEELTAKGTLLINDVTDRPGLAEALTAGTRALLAVGGTDDGRMITLSVSADREGAFDDEDVFFLRGLLDVTTVAMRNADLYEEVRYAAERDALTGLRNRRMFWTIVEAMLAGVTQHHPVSLAVLDIDDFKRLNDAHGHDVGDRALLHVASRLEAGVRETDAVFRIGGEEFVLALPGTGADGAMAALERIRAAVQVTRLDLPAMTVSAGVAVAVAPRTDADALFAAADTALYRAKRGGKNQVCLADEVAGGP
jgi:diguanylate cyclase (GGDEF)-like protein